MRETTDRSEAEDAPQTADELRRQLIALESAYAERTKKYRELEQAYDRRKRLHKNAESEYRAVVESRAWKVARLLRAAYRAATLRRWRRSAPQRAAVRRQIAAQRETEARAVDARGGASSDRLSRREESGPASPLASIPDAIDVAIVICVHNALDDVRACLASVAENTERPFSLVVVNDGSDEETSRYLREFSAPRPRVSLLVSDEATGYTRAVNRGIDAASGDFVVLLNSDVIVSRGWLDGLLACAWSDEKVGIVGPVSNAATWQSVPERFDREGGWCVNPLPDGFDVDRFADLVASVSPRRLPRVPLANGFCLGIKRAVIDAIGRMDEDAFPRGYGEENDFCMRARAAGFEIAIADDVYVFHAKSKSYTPERRSQISKESNRALRKKYGDGAIETCVEELRENAALGELRRAVADALSRPRQESAHSLRVLFVLPVSGGGGGVHSIVQDAVGMRRLGGSAQIAVPAKHRASFLARYPNVDPDVFVGFRSNDLLELVAGFDVVVATIFTSVKLVKNLVEAYPEIVPAYYIQDYEPWIVDRESSLYPEAVASYTLVPEMVPFAKTAWLCEKVKAEHGVRVERVRPSIDTEVYYPSFADGVDAPERPVRVVAMVRPSTPRRSPAETMAVLANCKRRFGDDVVIEVFGCRNDDPGFLALERNFAFTQRGELVREEVGELLRASDVFVDFSTYQAFGRTALEAMACGCATIVPRDGGASEYAVDGENALVVDTSSLEAMSDALARLLVDADLRRRLADRGVATALEYPLLGSAASELTLLRRAAARRRNPVWAN